MSAVAGYQMTKSRLNIVIYSLEHFASDFLNFYPDGQFELIDCVCSSLEDPVFEIPPKK